MPVLNPTAVLLRERMLFAALALAALGGCTETFHGFRATYISNTFSVAAAPPDRWKVAFQVRKQSTGSNGQVLRIVPHDAVLKLEGYMPLTPDAVTESGDAYLVTITLPEDAIKPGLTYRGAPRRFRGELFLPTETGVKSFTGREHRIPGRVYMNVELEPVYTGPLTTLQAKIQSFFRGLYSAR